MFQGWKDSIEFEVDMVDHKLLLIALCAYAYIVLHDIEKAPAKSLGPEMHVKVIGRQFTYFAKTDFGAGFTGTLFYCARQLISGSGGAVINDRNFCRHKISLR